MIITYSFWKFACLHVKSKTIHPKTAQGTRITAREEVDMTRAPLMIPKTTPISLQEANCINNQHDRALWKSRLGKYIWHGWRLGKKRFPPVSFSLLPFSCAQTNYLSVNVCVYMQSDSFSPCCMEIERRCTYGVQYGQQFKGIF